ncbi:MAG: HDIG domain-containing metalloprotein [Candidatus Liptonbacteria bacterium]
MPNREDAWQLLMEWVVSPNLRKHMLCVEAAMREYAKKYDENQELWGITGLLHDFDYEKYPVPDPIAKTGHPFEGVKVLKEMGYPPEIASAILGHAVYAGVPRDSLMAKCLFAVDELCGFLMAIAYMRPDKLAGITPEVVKKYLKREKFAEKVNRAEIAQGIKELEVGEDKHYELVIKALQDISQELGF